MNKKIIGVSGILLIVVMILFISSKNNNYIYSYKNNKIDADEYYEMLEEHYGTAFVYQFLEKEYFSKKELEKETQKQIAESSKELLEQSEREEDRKMLEVTLRSFGYRGIDDLETYMKNTYLKNKLIEDEFENYFKDYESYAQEYKPRIVTHVLVLAEEGLTSQVQKQMDLIDEKLSKSDDLKIDMLKLNDGEEVISEQLGYVDKDAQLVEEFLEASFKLKERELSDWVQTDYGYHRIYIESTSEKDIKRTPQFREVILNNYPSLGVEIVLDKMQQDGVKIEDDLLAKFLEMAGS